MFTIVIGLKYSHPDQNLFFFKSILFYNLVRFMKERRTENFPFSEGNKLFLFLKLDHIYLLKNLSDCNDQDNVA